MTSGGRITRHTKIAHREKTRAGWPYRVVHGLAHIGGVLASRCRMGSSNSK